MYCCPIECPGRIPEPYHLPGYSGHIPTKRERNGATFGRMSRQVIEDPCVPQSPCPILAPPMSKSRCCPPNPCMRNPVGCEDIGCCDPVCCPPPRVYQKPRKPPCPKICCDPCTIMKYFPGQTDCCQPQQRPCSPPPMNFSPPPQISCYPPPQCPPPPCRPAQLNSGRTTFPPPNCVSQSCGSSDPGSQIYRCCESLSSSYAGHIPGFTFHSTARTKAKATWGTKQYMNKCFYFNTWTKP